MPSTCIVGINAIHVQEKLNNGYKERTTSVSHMLSDGTTLTLQVLLWWSLDESLGIVQVFLWGFWKIASTQICTFWDLKAPYRCPYWGKGNVQFSRLSGAFNRSNVLMAMDSWRNEEWAQKPLGLQWSSFEPNLKGLSRCPLVQHTSQNPGW